MAEASLKLGTDWATKEDYLLGYNDENGNYKPIPFDFSRASIGTRVNRDGLIEVVQDNIPRIDFTDSDGSLLLEPQRTNLLPYSEDFNNAAWNKINSTINSNQTISPKGDLTADLLSATTTNGSYFIDVVFVTPAQKYTYSIFAKKSNSDYFAFIIVDGANVVRQCYNVSDGLVGITNNTGSPIVENIKIENYGNGWYRCSLTVQSVNSAVEFRNYVIQNDGIFTAPIGSEIFLWGAQAELGSYPTSYIPTSGSAVTRVGETCNNAGNASTFNDSEGVLYAEIAALYDDLTFRQLGVSGTSGNEVNLSYDSVSNRIGGIVRSSGTYYILNHIVSDTTSIAKVAIKYKVNDISLYVNGLEVDSISTAVMPSSLNSFDFSIGFTKANKFYGNAKQILYFPTALTDEELATLTTI